MKLFGLLGYPVGHSASPAMMNAAFQAQNEAAVYLPFAVPPEQIEVALNGLQALGAVGVNVTIPHKRSAYAWVKQRTAEAELVGAVNTVRFTADGAIGHNTDVSGWWKSVAPYVQSNQPRVVIIGAGGAAMAILAAIASQRPSAHVVMAARRENAVDDLRQLFAHRLTIHYATWEARASEIAQADLIIQTTPIGMWPAIAQSPVEDAGVFSAGQVVQDIVYRPRQTQFMRLAAEQGATVVDGVSMLVYQGVDAYEWWLDKKAPVDTMFAAVNDKLAAEQTEHE